MSGPVVCKNCSAATYNDPGKTYLVCGSCFDSLRVELAKEREEKEALKKKNSEQAGWIHLTKSHAPYQAACGEFMARSEQCLQQKEAAEARLQHLQTICGQPNCGDFEAAMCEWKAKAEAAEAQVVALQNPRKLAKRFHDIYEALAAEFHYKTREDTKIFDPESSNGQLMIATCKVILQSLPAHATKYQAVVEDIKPCSDDELYAVYHKAYNDFAGPKEFRHACNFDDYHKAGLRAVYKAVRQLKED